MKIYLSILICLLFSCSFSEKKTTKNIIPEIQFETILKEIHLEQASLNKNQNMKSAEIKLSNKISDIYKKHKVSEKDFTESLNYYVENIDKLEIIYNNLLQQLKNERSKIDLQETN